MELLRLKCPVCHSSDMKYHSVYTTKNHGGRVIYKCEHCPVYFSETKNTLMEGLTTPVSVIWQVLKARTEGLGLNAAARTFEKAKNTILAWERKCIDLHQVLFLYALVHEFLELVIEGDEAYTKVQNKGSQAHKKGRKRPKYQSPWREHPATARTIAETDIHANHAEAFWSALRRKCATFRRKTNTYAKATKGLQRLLRVYWVMHNFLRVHFTIREVPAVALGILERRLSVHEIFQIQMA